MGYKAWQLGKPGGSLYGFYDLLRRRLNHRLVSYLLNAGIPENSCVVLEAGSGPAFATSILSCDNRVGLAVAIDIDIEALKEARLRDECLNVIVADLENLPGFLNELLFNIANFEKGILKTFDLPFGSSILA
ncbi:MAG: class I SAM-dependent methyltransferase, partial [Deltaproteobacteria bacterium]|nr:class I SAM-dependent methyltransferase [Deltaproteobacteria bacterium]